MTLQVELHECKYCGFTINHYGDRGNGRQRDFCDRTCTTRMYMLSKRITNYMSQMKLRKHAFDFEGEFSENIFKFMKLAVDYIETGLPAIRLVTHVNAALDGKNIVPVEAVFRNIVELKGKEKCLI